MRPFGLCFLAIRVGLRSCEYTALFHYSSSCETYASFETNIERDFDITVGIGNEDPQVSVNWVNDNTIFFGFILFSF